MTKFPLIFLAALALLGCSKNESADVDPIVQNIVTYEATSDDGTVSTFSFQAVDDSPLITISATWSPPADLLPGTRLLATYSTTTPSVSGAVELRGLQTIPGGIPIDTCAIANLSSEGIGLRSIWRSGQYLNLTGSVYFTGNAGDVSLLVDSLSLSQPDVDAWIHVGIDPNNPNVGSSAPRSLVASWNIAEIWNNPLLQTLRIHYKSTSNKIESININKNN